MAGATASPAPDTILHASCVAFGDKAALFKGRSGSGKSTLALELLSRGGRLVSDDRTCLRLGPEGVIAFAPDALKGLIEVRGVGILNAETAGPSCVSLVIDMDKIEQDRLPPSRCCDVLGAEIPLLYKVDGPHFAAAVKHYLTAGPWTQA